MVGRQSHRIMILVAAVCVFIGIAHGADETLSADRVREILVGNTEKAHTNGVPYVEYYTVEGEVKGKMQGSIYSGVYEIRQDGCVYIDYDEGAEYDGCYYLVEFKKGRYQVVYPSGKKEKIKLLEGNPERL